MFVPGVPAPQGSAKAYVVKGRAHITSDNPHTMPWRATVAAHVRSHVGPTIPHPTGPVALGMVFVMPRRKAEPKRVTPPHTRKPDCDKLQRATLDALTGVLYADDSQVDTIGAHKRTAGVGEAPGLWLEWSGGVAGTQTSALDPHLQAPAATSGDFHAPTGHRD